MCGIAGIIAAPGTEVNLDAVYAMRQALNQAYERHLVDVEAQIADEEHTADEI